MSWISSGFLLFTNLPAGMSFEEAYRRFTEALGYLHAGPWVFTLPVVP